jgi:replication factor C subunit 3/5
MKYATSILPHDAAIDAPDWESFVKDIAGSICAKQSPDVLLQVRGHLYELLTNCIPPELIFRRLVIELLKKIDDSLKAEVLHWAAFYEHRSHLGSKPMYVLRKRVTLCSSSFFKIFVADSTWKPLLRDSWRCTSSSWYQCSCEFTGAE